MERRKQEDELKRVQQQEEHFKRVKVRIIWCPFKRRKLLSAKICSLASAVGIYICFWVYLVCI